MDALTARKMSTVGLNATKPLLPPVHNLGMIYLKEPLSDADEHLHNARLALKNVEEAPKSLGKDATTRLRLELHSAMEKLQEKEQEYFARRYASDDKEVIHGWKKRLTLFLEYVHEITRKQYNDVLELGAQVFSVDISETVFEMADIVTQMNRLCLAENGSRLKDIPLAVLLNGRRKLKSLEEDINVMRETILFDDNADTKSQGLAEKADDMAEVLILVADNMINKNWDVTEIYEQAIDSQLEI